MRSRAYGLALSWALVLPATAFAAPDKAPAVVVERAVLEPLVEQVQVTGTVIAPRVSRLSTEVAGQIEHVRVDIGDRVETGQVLVSLDRELREIALAAAQAVEHEAAAALRDARRRLAEAERLTAQQTIAATEVDARRAEVETDAAVLEQRRVAVRRERALIERHVLKAPYAGAVRAKLSDAGEWVDTGTPVLELVAVNDLRIDFQVPQEYYPRVDTDTAVTVTLDAWPDRTFEARVSGIVPVSEMGSRTFLLLTRLATTDIALIPGMSARALLHLDTGSRGVVVPRDALLRYPDGRVSVWQVMQTDGGVRAEERFVSLGRSLGTRIEIRSGIESGAEVVVRGNEGLQSGQLIRVIEQP